MEKQYTDSGISVLLTQRPALSSDADWWEKKLTEEEIRTIIDLSLRAPGNLGEYQEKNRFDRFHASVNRFLERQLPDGDVCSLAAGTGARELWMARRAPRRRSFYLSDLFYHGYLDQCRPIFAEAGCAEAIHPTPGPVNVTSLPYLDRRFDGLFAGSVLYALDDDEVSAMLMEVQRVLRPGGIAVIWCYSFITPMDRLRAWVRKLPLRRHGKERGRLKHCGFLRTRKEMDRLFDAVPGLRVRRFFRIGHKFAPHAGAWIGSLLTLVDFRAGGYVVESVVPQGNAPGSEISAGAEQ